MQTRYGKGVASCGRARLPTQELACAQDEEEAPTSWQAIILNCSNLTAYA